MFDNLNCVKRKDIYSLDKASELIINGCKRAVMILKVKQKYLTTLTVILVMKVIPKLSLLLLMINFQVIQLAQEPLNVDCYIRIQSVIEYSQKKQRKTVALHNVYTVYKSPVRNTFKKTTVIRLSVSPTKQQYLVLLPRTQSAVIDFFFELFDPSFQNGFSMLNTFADYKLTVKMRPADNIRFIPNCRQLASSKVFVAFTAS